jgi:RNA polymerase sigma-70 factor (ECF subfamily)
MAGDVAHIALVPGRAEATRGADAADALFAALAERARGGDLAAFDELMTLTERRVVSIAWRMLGDKDDARDAAQEVFLRVYRSLGQYRTGEPFMAWVYRITVNVCRDVGRKRRRYSDRNVPLDGHEPVDAGAALDERVLERQRREIVARALESLPEREREAFVLRDLEGLSTDEVARLLGTRPVTVRSQASMARTKIKAYCSRVLGRGGKE